MDIIIHSSGSLGTPCSAYNKKISSSRVHGIHLRSHRAKPESSFFLPNVTEQDMLFTCVFLCLFVLIAKCYGYGEMHEAFWSKWNVFSVNIGETEIWLHPFMPWKHRRKFVMLVCELWKVWLALLKIHLTVSFQKFYQTHWVLFKICLQLMQINSHLLWTHD